MTNLRRWISALGLSIVVAVVAALAIASQNAAPAALLPEDALMTTPTVTEGLATHVRTLVDDLVHHRFDHVHKDFNAEMASQLSLDQLRLIWTALEGQVGGFLSIGDVRSRAQPGVTIFLVRCNFVLQAVDVRLVLNHERKIMGLFVQPPATPEQESM